MTDTIAIGKFNPDTPIILRRAGNGGWTITQLEDPRVMEAIIGAYSSAEDMIRALASALTPALSESQLTLETRVLDEWIRRIKSEAQTP